MENGKFTVEFNSDNGGLKSLVLKNDADRMNWIEGLGTWGVPAGMEFLGAEQKDSKSVFRYRRGEFFDPWANDQDFALYYILRAEDETGLALKDHKRL